MISIDLSGKIAIVTGAGGGLGKATALKLAEAGASVVVSDINLENAQNVADEIKKMGVPSKAIKTNVSIEEEVNNLVETTINEFGTLDILVNNAGINITAPFVGVDSEGFDKLINVNIKGVYYGCKAALKHMIPKQQGKIVNFSSMAGKEGFGLASHYGATKFAVLGLTQAIAKEVGQYNINVNAVCPGIIRTEMWEKMLSEGSQFTGQSREEMWKTVTSPIPLGRPQEPEDIANMVAYLCSDLAKNMTGQGINITGGQQVH